MKKNPKNYFTKIILTCFLLLLSSNFINKARAQIPTPIAVGCGTIYTDRLSPTGDPLVIHGCTCQTSSSISSTSTERTFCCGWWIASANTCSATEPTGPLISPTLPPQPTSRVPNVDNQTLDKFNPLKNFSSKADQLSTPGGIISEILRFAFPIAGIILFVMLIIAGLKMLTGATNSNSLEEGKKIISTAILGFIILFAAYWIAQLLEIIFGINILGN